MNSKIFPNPFFKLLLELIVIFSSVVLAFFFDDYRESKSVENQYKSELLSFRNGLAGEIGGIYTETDSFYVADDPPYRGNKLKKLMSLIWFEKLLDEKRATMNDFRYIVAQDYLTSELSGKTLDLQAIDILLKYTEQFKTKGENGVTKFLKRYVVEAGTSQELKTLMQDDSKELDKFLHQLNPYLNFDKKDSLVIYSHEFIWAYKTFVLDNKNISWRSKKLANDRLIGVIRAIDRELELLGVDFPKNTKCLSVHFNDRFECENDRAIAPSDSLKKIEDALVHERALYLSKKIPLKYWGGVILK